MCIKKRLLFTHAVLITVLSFAQTGKETEIFLTRYRDYLFKTDSTYRNFDKSFPLTETGRWEDIDYADNQPTRWQLHVQLDRIKTMALAWSHQHSSFYHKPEIKKSIDKGLEDWFRHRYISKNWWHNEIGIPQKMRDIIILMRDSLNEAQMKNCMQILAQYRVKGTGANLTWSADLGLHFGVLTNNSALVKKCRDTILSVIKITTNEGVQPDYSFHQHGKRLQMYQYGRSFLLDNLRLAWQLKGLTYEFPDIKIRLLADFTLKGWQWMARGVHTVPGTMDRASTRMNALQSADIRNHLPLFYELMQDSRNEFRKMEESQNGEYSLTGYRYFPYSDFTAVHKKEFSFFLKTISKRTLPTESINEENLKGELLNTGDTYFISDGTEYYNLLPFWDWDRLPGITNFAGDRKNKVKSSPVAGNVSDGNNGLAVMNYDLVKNQEYLGVNKFWASWNNVTVVLMAMKSKQLKSYPFTVMDQCRWTGPVTMNKPGNILEAGTHSFAETEWIHHGNFLYIPINDDRIKVDIRNISSRWSDINRSGPSAVIHDNILMPSIIHYQSNSGYVVAYEPDVNKATETVAAPSWKVLKNDTTCQAVQFSDSLLMAAMYTAEPVLLEENLKIHSGKPLLLLINGDTVLVSDPTHSGGRIKFLINGTQFSANLPADGRTVKAVAEK